MPVSDAATGAEMAAALITMSDAVNPFVDAASGMRRRLVNEGWTVGEAEASAGLYLRSLITSLFAASVP